MAQIAPLTATKYEVVEHESAAKTTIVDPCGMLRAAEKAPKGQKDPS